MVIDYGKIIFGGIDSSEYGIYISGEGTYNAPERAVEFVNVPGRNGAIALDQGRYENITITYPAMVLEDDQETFRERLSAFRNAILSQKGYQRLEDSYHPDEYRMGLYHAGLSVSDLLTFHQGGNFELTFECKPQRFLTVGDYPVPLDSGDVLQNPTLFDSGPLVEISGYGTVGFNGYEIEVADELIGEIDLIDRINLLYYKAPDPSSERFTFDDSKLVSGDTITIPKGPNTPYMSFGAEFVTSSAAYTLASASITADGSDTGTVANSYVSETDEGYTAYILGRIDPVSDITFAYGTASSRTLKGTLSFTLNSNAVTIEGTLKIMYDGANHLTFTFRMTKTGTTTGTLRRIFAFNSTEPVTGDSHMTVWGTVWVDCERHTSMRTEKSSI
ncbi:MAG: hypothetical protein Q4C03_01465 [bacterium]|nr:hypothetical protein [bacterium]